MGLRPTRACARLLSCACFLLSASILNAEEPGRLFEALWSRATERRLWDHPGWWTLGHYHRTPWGTVSSRIDDPAFFLHPHGKHDRRGELAATLRAFLEPPADPPPERSVACRFPARRQWLIEQLEIPADLLAPDCPDYHAVLAELDITRAVLVYPSAYLNSPASMFGHLLLVLDRESRDRLLSRAVNYAANVTDTFGPLFAFKGICGLYPGMYVLMPYSDKVEEYSAINRRDIWEYPLRLNPDELDRLLRHVWELQGIRSRYFFFKENCAFNLLYPIEAARPEVALTRRFRTHAIPVSLLREIATSGLTEPPEFRPSKTTIMEALASSLPPAAVDRALALSQGQTLQGNEDAHTLSLAIELTQFRYTERRITPEVYRERVFPLLRARAAHGRVAPPPVPTPTPPHLGHPPARVQFSLGESSREGAWAGLRHRFAYHDPLDDPAAYPPGSYITFLQTDLRFREGDLVRLESLTLFDITSLSPAKPWATPLSWAASLRAEANPFDPSHHRGFLRFASGRAWNAPGSSLAYLMLDNALRVDGDLDAGVGWEPGLRWGVVAAGHRLRAIAGATHHVGVWGSSAERHEAAIALRRSLIGDMDGGISLRRLWEDGRHDTLVDVSLGLAF